MSLFLRADGRAIFFPGKLADKPLYLTSAFLWQGKVFKTQSDTQVLSNRVVGLRGIKVDVYYGRSLMDGKKSIIIDYKKTSLIANSIRDEIRMIAPGLYLGRAYVLKPKSHKLVVNFVLDFRKNSF